MTSPDPGRHSDSIHQHDFVFGDSISQSRELKSLFQCSMFVQSQRQAARLDTLCTTGVGLVSEPGGHLSRQSFSFQSFGLEL